MTKRAEIEFEEAYIEDQDIGEEDYGFIFDSEGNIKYIFVPEVLPFKPPKTIARIMKVLGVSDLSQFNDDIPLH